MSKKNFVVQEQQSRLLFAGLTGQVLAKRIEAPGASACNEQVKKDETIEYSQLSMIQQRPETIGRVPLKVGDRHFSRQDKGHRASKDSQEEENAPKELENSCNPNQRKRIESVEGLVGRHSEKFLAPVLQEHKGYCNSHDAQKARGPR